jgi:hypothetical protein
MTFRLMTVFALLGGMATLNGNPIRIQQPLFVAAPDVPVGPGSGQILLADLNEDGKVDLVARHLLQRQVSIFLGDGKGNFAAGPAPRLTLPYQPGTIALADMNGDRHADLIVTSSQRDELDILSGDGLGNFTRVARAPFGAGPSANFYTRGLFVADIDEDGRPDAIITNGRDSTFSVLFTLPGGAFADPRVVHREANQALERQIFAAGDINGDGHVDVVMATLTDDPARPGRVAFYMGDGKGEFRLAAKTLSVPSSPHFVTLADVNADGRPDLLISHSGSPLISVLLNGGGLDFEAAPGSPFNAGAETFDLDVADVNSDGAADLIGATGPTVRVWLGDRSGRFAGAAGSSFRTSPGAYHLAVRDINGDGSPDIVTPSFEGSVATVLLSRRSSVPSIPPDPSR